MVMLSTGKLPRNVLTGKKRGYSSVWTVYKVRFVERFMEILNQSFWSRAQTGADEDGNTWDPLSERTLQDKAEMIAMGEITPQHTGDYRYGKLYNAGVTGGDRQNYGLLTPTQRAAYNLLFERELRKAKRGRSDAKARTIARREAMKQLHPKIVAGIDEIPINIRTGRLVAATAPGIITHNRYTPPTSDQDIEINDASVHLSFTRIPYAQAVDARREIIPKKLNEWVEDAHAYALGYAEAEYDRINDGKKSQREIDKMNERRRIKRANKDVPF